MFRFRYHLDCIKHWLSSNSRHGVHSPFVYRLVDEVIYNFRAQNLGDQVYVSSQKSNQLIHRLIAFHQPQVIIHATDLPDATPFIDLMIIQSGDYKPAVFNRFLQRTHPGTLLILEEIYSNKAMKKAWQEIKTQPGATVCIDLFSLGLVYFREGQAKENFKIRF